MVREKSLMINNSGTKFPYSSIFQVYFVLLVVMEFNLLLHFPISQVQKGLDLFFLVTLGVFMVYYLRQAIQERKINLIFFVALPVMILPFIGAFQADRVFGQPFWYGVLAERSKYYVIGGLMTVHALEKGWISFSQLQKILFSTAFTYFIVAIALYLLVDPHLFEDSAFVTFSKHKGFRYKVNQSLTIFLFFYSLTQLIHHKKWAFLPLLVGILGYLFVFVKGRSLLLAVIVASAIFMLYSLNRRQLVKAVSMSVIGLVIIGSVVKVGFPEVWDKNVQLFTSALNVFIGGEVEDGSAYSRIVQAKTGWSGFKEHPIIGNGHITSKYKTRHLGYGFRHFFPSDIGWLGILFVHGIFGFLVLMSPFVLAFKYFRKRRVPKSEVFYHTLQVFFIYTFIHCIVAAFPLKKDGYIFLVFTILYLYHYRKRENDGFYLDDKVNIRSNSARN